MLANWISSSSRSKKTSPTAHLLLIPTLNNRRILSPSETLLSSSRIINYNWTIWTTAPGGQIKGYLFVTFPPRINLKESELMIILRKILFFIPREQICSLTELYTLSIMPINTEESGSSTLNLSLTIITILTITILTIRIIRIRMRFHWNIKVGLN